MDKLLNAIASRLKVQVVKKAQPKNSTNNALALTLATVVEKDISEEVKNLFKKEFHDHLVSKIKETKVGEYVEYSYNDAIVRPLGRLLYNANDNMAEVLLKLPALKEGESYIFPRDTYIRFELIEKNSKEATVYPDVVCPWITEAHRTQ